MVFDLKFKMAAPKEKSVQSDLPDDAWMLRPCEIYLEEFSDCASFKGRFHQYYTDGSYADCKRWQDDYKNCLQFRKSGDVSVAEPIIANERERRQTRLDGARNNDVWEYRRNPPADWNTPLQDWMNKREESVLAKAQEQKENTGTMSVPESESRCVIS